ncbi:Chondroitin synthase [Thalassocella blandensis]|nr:Chondroitin synthase [Thalassocella blandensis]
MLNFSIVLIIKDDEKLISCALRSMETLNYSKELFEVIVVDDGSEVPVQSRIQQGFSFDITMIYAPRIAGVSSRARARNLGAKEAKGRYLVFVDGDHFVYPDFLSRYENAISEYSQYKVFLGKRHHIQYEYYESYFNSGEFKTKQECDESVQGVDERDHILNRINVSFAELHARWNLFWSCNFCIEKQMFFDLGLFDENFIEWGMEDTELGYRLLTQGYDFPILDNYVAHFVGAQPITPEKYHGWIKNLQYFYHKFNDMRILEQLTFDSLLFKSAFMPSKKQSDYVELFVEFEQKLRYLDSINFSRDYTHPSN